MIDINKKISENIIKFGNKTYIKDLSNNDEISYKEFVNKINCYAKYLLSQNLRNKKIIIYGNNSINLMAYDAAITFYVGTSIIVSNKWTDTELNECIENNKIDAIIYSMDKEEIVKKLNHNYIIFINMDANIKSDGYDLEFEKVKNENICSKVVFSSGTTGRSKGIMLSLKNIFAGMEPLLKRCKFNDSDSSYLFLPLSHTYGEIYNFLYSFIIGYSIYLASSPNNMMNELLETNPTIFCGVPIVYERILKAYGDKISEAFGKNIKYLFCGGAKLDKEIRRKYQDSGLNFMQAYALSETASSFAISYPFPKGLEDSGEIFENIDVKIINKNKVGIGDIVCKGDMVFIGYLNDEDLTRKSFTEDGYFITNDLGKIEDNKIIISKRKGKSYVLKNGIKLKAEELEDRAKKIDTKINSVKTYMEKGELKYILYVTNDIGLDEKIRKYNENLQSYLKIKSYKIIKDDLTTRLK